VARTMIDDWSSAVLDVASFSSCR